MPSEKSSRPGHGFKAPSAAPQPADLHKGRGAVLNLQNRFEVWGREKADDGWDHNGYDDDAEPLKTIVTIERAKTIITRNDSPDIGFNLSVNPYRGCEHGCVYCFARPSHGYLGLSPGLDFETRLFAKVNAPELLRGELAHPRYQCECITLGVNTDAYQPIEREYRITRQLLEVMSEFNQPVSLITKSALIERDIDILASLAERRLVHVTISITTLLHEISRYLEPRTSAPARRLLAVQRLAAAGIPTSVNVAPIIPFLTDSELEPILEAAAQAGATSAAYTVVRLPWEVKDLFRAWLDAHFPLKARHVMSRVHAIRDGKDNDPGFGTRMVGSGIYSELLKQRFDKACTRFGLDKRSVREAEKLDTAAFKPPAGPQMDLF